LQKKKKLNGSNRTFSKFQHFFNDRPIKLTWCLQKKEKKQREKKEKERASRCTTTN
jgi:hypothetical protein